MRSLPLLLAVACAAPAGVPAPQHSSGPTHTVRHSAHDDAVTIAHQIEGATHWTYNGDDGPENWSSLDADFDVCGGGPYQSPVELMAVGASWHDDSLAFDYGVPEVDVLNNGHTIQINLEEGDEAHLTLNEHRYALIQGHFHTPSEHTINGERFPMELHLVHVDAYDHLAVVGVPIRIGAENLDSRWTFEHLPQRPGEHYSAEGLTLDLSHLVPNATPFLHYLGSLTTPPCTENVQWLVLETPIELSQGQVDAFTTIIGDNARPLVGLHHRIVTRNGSM